MVEALLQDRSGTGMLIIGSRFVITLLPMIMQMMKASVSEFVISWF